MNGHESPKQLALAEQAFNALAACANQIRKSNVTVDEGGFTWALASIGSRLLIATQQGAEGEMRLLRHWVTHAPEICQALISKAERSNKRTITADDVMSAFRKAPPPNFL